MLNSTKYSKKISYISFSKSSKKMCRWKFFLTHFYKVNITLITKLGKNNTKKENYRSIHLMNAVYAKLLNRILANQIQQYKEDTP